MASAEALEAIEAEIMIIEGVIDEIEESRIARLREAVHLESDLQAFIYVADDSNQISIEQDAPFVAEQIMLIGDQVTKGSSSNPNAVAVEFNILGGETLTEGTSVPTTNNLPNTFAVAQSQTSIMVPQQTLTIPIDVFVPAAAFSGTFASPLNIRPKTCPNNDFSHVLPVEWFIPKGSSILAQFRQDAPSGATGYTGTLYSPDPVFIGHKVTP